MELRGDKHKKSRNGVSPGKRNSLALISERYIYRQWHGNPVLNLLVRFITLQAVATVERPKSLRQLLLSFHHPSSDRLSSPFSHDIIKIKKIYDSGKN